MYKGGVKTAMKDFDRAYEWALNYPYTSLGDYASVYDRPIIDREMLAERFTHKEYRAFCRDFFNKQDVIAKEVVFEW